MELTIGKTGITATASGEPRTLVTRRGRSVSTSFTDIEAYDVCKRLTDVSFAQDLASHQFRNLSAEQMIWCHILAVDNTSIVGGLKLDANISSISGILKLFAAAKTRLVYPALRLVVQSGAEIKVCLAGPEARYPGNIYVKNADKSKNVYYGRITQDGQFIATPDATPEIVQLLEALAEDPEGTAAAYGRMTGRCSFCDIELTDERSLSVGYGQRCAKNYGLKWGKGAAQQAKAAHGELIAA